MSNIAKIATPQFRTPYNIDPNIHSDQFGVDDGGEPSRTHQSFKDEADINTIVRNFGVTGQVHAPLQEPTYGDFTQTNDYREILDIQREAENAFMSLPSAIRERFHHDPVEFCEFFNDASNREEAIKLGLIEASYEQRIVPQTGAKNSAQNQEVEGE